MKFFSNSAKTLIFSSTCFLSSCAMQPPKLPEVVGESRPINMVQNTPKLGIICSHTATAEIGTVINMPATNKELDWEILEVDGTLKNTLERWAKVADWEIIWTGLPEFKNPGYVKLARRDFISATNYTLSKARNAAKEAGFEIFITAYPNRVLVISKEAPQ